MRECANEAQILQWNLNCFHPKTWHEMALKVNCLFFLYIYLFIICLVYIHLARFQLSYSVLFLVWFARSQKESAEITVKCSIIWVILSLCVHMNTLWYKLKILQILYIISCSWKHCMEYWKQYFQIWLVDLHVCILYYIKNNRPFRLQIGLKRYCNVLSIITWIMPSIAIPILPSLPTKLL